MHSVGKRWERREREKKNSSKAAKMKQKTSPNT